MASSDQYSSQEDKWKDLAVKAQKGDRKAYNELLRDLVPFIKAVITPKLSNPQWADDITQDVLLSVHKSLHTFAPDRPIKPWLISIIHFRKTDFLRAYYSKRGDKKVSTDDYSFQNQYVTEPGSIGEYKDIALILSELPDNQRQIFEMIKIEGYSAKEVAEKMGMSESAVKVSAHRTLNKLKELRNRID